MKKANNKKESSKKSEIIMIRDKWNPQKQDYDFISLAEFILSLKGLVLEPMQNAWEMDGDMFLSDYQKLSQAAHNIRSACEEIKKQKSEGKI